MFLYFKKTHNYIKLLDLCIKIQIHLRSQLILQSGCCFASLQYKSNLGEEEPLGVCEFIKSSSSLVQIISSALRVMPT